METRYELPVVGLDNAFEPAEGRGISRIRVAGRTILATSFLKRQSITDRQRKIVATYGRRAKVVPITGPNGEPDIRITIDGLPYCTVLSVVNGLYIAAVIEHKAGFSGRNGLTIVPSTGLARSGESMVDAAIREYREEVGLPITTMSELTDHPIPVMPSQNSGARCYSYLIQSDGVALRAEPKPDRGEWTVPVLIPLTVWFEMLDIGGYTEECGYIATQTALSVNNDLYNAYGVYRASHPQRRLRPVNLHVRLQKP